MSQLASESTCGVLDMYYLLLFILVREARLKEIRSEMLASDKLKVSTETNS